MRRIVYHIKPASEGFHITRSVGIGAVEYLKMGRRVRVFPSEHMAYVEVRKQLTSDKAAATRLGMNSNITGMSIQVWP